MKFMMLVHETTRPTDQPPSELFAAIGALGAQESAAGTLIEVGGLMPIQAGAVVTLAGAAIATTDGPFVEATELVGGYSVSAASEPNLHSQTLIIAGPPRPSPDRVGPRPQLNVACRRIHRGAAGDHSLG